MFIFPADISYHLLKTVFKESNDLKLIFTDDYINIKIDFLKVCFLSILK